MRPKDETKTGEKKQETKEREKEEVIFKFMTHKAVFQGHFFSLTIKLKI